MQKNYNSTYKFFVLNYRWFFPFQFFWASKMFRRFWTRILDFQGLESGLRQNSCKRQPFANYIIIKSKESKSYKRIILTRIILTWCRNLFFFGAEIVLNWHYSYSLLVSIFLYWHQLTFNQYTWVSFFETQ